MANTEHRLLSIAEAQTYLGIGRTTLWQLVKDGRLSAVRIGRRSLFDVTELDRYIEELKAVA